MTDKSYVILHPNSATNNSPWYRIVDFDKWRQYSDGEIHYLPSVSDHSTYAAADAAADKLNGRVEA